MATRIAFNFYLNNKVIKDLNVIGYKGENKTGMLYIKVRFTLVGGFSSYTNMFIICKPWIVCQSLNYRLIF